eukprot:TRINITY_DN15124_c0_g1_i2.p1 TRINITY_DN15124_c0_g1~~TRINITY_DN15124_c0_g1_i2.p1  ORF type:complete len:886 (+),score=171.57 TRINITY_DN15124_c0_g1_i2:84-2660(+)
MLQCCQAIARPALSVNDTPEERHTKLLWIPVCAVVGSLCLIAYATNIDAEQPLRAHLIGYLMIVATAVANITLAYVKKVAPLGFVGLSIIFVSLAVCLIDLNRAAAGTQFRRWAWIVLSMDLQLAADVPTVYQQITLVLATLWILVSAVEGAYRLGLYDIDGFSEEGSEASATCNCANFPCATGIDSAWFPAVAGMVAILHLDFFATRAEKARVDSSVRVSERVTHLLATYATDDARKVVAKEGEALPEPLRHSYEQLLDNLDSYRVFLPDSLLYAAVQQQQQQQSPAGVSNQDSPRAARAAPGHDCAAAEVAVCFTDIQSSTELWEAHPQGMYEALNVHNWVMRETYAACNGYEVKTIGDSFMVVFDGAGDALRFGLDVQRGLLRQEWPDDLLRHPLCCQVSGSEGQPLWGGLRVRVGVQCGPTRIERNPVTGRCDYFGHTVNTAARLEAVLRKGGLVATASSVMQSIGPSDLQLLGTPVVRHLGAKELKGVKQAVEVCALAPQGLGERFDVLSEADRVLPPAGPYGSISEGARDGDHSSIGCSSASSFREHSGRHGRSDSAWSTGSGLAPRTRRMLRHSNGTCAVARAVLHLIDAVGDRIPHFVAAACLAADKTQGVVDCVLSACVFVTWNTSRSCADHTAACCNFFAAPFRVPLALGAASGGVLYGRVPAGRRSFATVVGGCVEFAAALAEEAERCGDAALAAGAVAETCIAFGAASRAQLWESPSGATVLVYTVRCDETADKWMLLQEDDEFRAGRCDTAASAELFTKICAAAPEEQEALQSALRAQAVGEGGHVEALRLADRIAGGKVRTRPMPHLWDPKCSPDPQSPSVSAGCADVFVVHTPTPSDYGGNCA